MSHRDRLEELLAAHMDPCRNASSWTDEAGKIHYRAWMRCRCGWQSPDMPGDGNVPEVRRVMAKHWVKMITEEFGAMVILATVKPTPPLCDGGYYDGMFTGDNGGIIPCCTQDGIDPDAWRFVQ